MPMMDWEEFLRDHHRPHLLALILEGTISAKHLKSGLERLALRLGAVGNYAFMMEGRTVYAAFEESADADRFADVFGSEQITREAEWATKAVARIDNTTYRRIARLLESDD